ncbi:MAG: hypothetical protein JNG90_03285 [Planctomycetaceae bacterium]|nr:hypothetical protein [Planctomycetaceae bacterium]
MPQTYQKLGLQFQYPDNWTIDEEDALAGNATVSVQSPEGGFWSVTLHPVAADLPELLAGAVAAMREVYEQLDSEPVQETIGVHELEGFDMNFYCLDLTNTACVRGLRTRRGTLVIFWQAEDREYARSEPIFQAMTISLLRAS